MLSDLDKLREITKWMCNDISNSIFNAKANFLVALGLVNYTEILGSFISDTTAALLRIFLSLSNRSSINPTEA